MQDQKKFSCQKLASNLILNPVKKIGEDASISVQSQKVMVNKLAKQYAQNNGKYIDNYYGKLQNMQMHHQIQRPAKEFDTEYDPSVKIKKPPKAEKPLTTNFTKNVGNDLSKITSHSIKNPKDFLNNINIPKAGLTANTIFQRNIKSINSKSLAVIHKPNTVIESNKKLFKPKNYDILS